jgi:hypothetical protein
MALALLAGFFAQWPAHPVVAEAPSDAPARMRAWYFAEGNSRHDFQTFFTLLNLSDQPASVTASYDRDDSIRLLQWIGIEPHGRVSLNANDVVGLHAFGASFTADQDIVVERATTWGPGQNGETTVGFAPQGRRDWAFAEGTTLSGIATYFVTQNQSDTPPDVSGTFVREDGSVVHRDVTLAPRARDAFRVNDILPDSAFSARFKSNQDIVVERTIMSEGEHGPQAVGGKRVPGKRGEATNGLAAGERSTIDQTFGILGGMGYPLDDGDAGTRSWSFAEGSTRRPYDTYFVLFNPGQQAATATLSLTPQTGDTKTSTVSVPALRRVALNARDIVPLADFTTTITSDAPIVAERAYYSSGDGLYGALGYTPSPPRDHSRTWYFADVNTGSQIETYFIVSNLTDQPAQVQATYFGDGPAKPQQSVMVPANGRLSIRVNDAMPDQAFAARFAADRDIVVERTVYFPGGSGFASLGAASQ